MAKKAVIFDVDGTAVNSPHEKLPSDKLASGMLSLKDRYFFCAATGRVWSFAKPVLGFLRLTDPCIISAGTQICDPSTGEILYQKNLSEKSLHAALDVFKKYPDWKLVFNDGTEEDYFNGGVYPEEFDSSDPVYFLEQVFVPDEIALKINENLSGIDGIASVMVVSQKPGCRDIHVINKNATKEHAVSELLNILGLDRKQTIGIGDGYNDIHLFNAVDKKVAMGNAVPELKKVADIVIDSVENDGLAKYIDGLK